MQCSLAPGTEALAQDLWHIKLTPSQGRGVFALRALPKGTHLLTEAPLFSVATPVLVPGKGFEMAAMVADVARAYARLSPAEQQVYLSCHEERLPGEEEEDQEEEEEEERLGLMAIFRSNAYTMGSSGRVGIYPNVALINHSCQPNVMNADNGEGTRVVVATRDIMPGEEVCLLMIHGLEAIE